MHRDEFLHAVCNTSNAVLQLITVLLVGAQSGSLSQSEHENGLDVLRSIIDDFRDAVNESEFSNSCMVKHVDNLDRLADFAYFSK